MDGWEGAGVFWNRYHEIDGVILDLEMPVMSGNETLIVLKAIDPGVRALVSSGFREDPRVVSFKSPTPSESFPKMFPSSSPVSPRIRLRVGGKNQPPVTTLPILFIIH